MFDPDSDPCELVRSIGGVVAGTLVWLPAAHAPVVDYPGNPLGRGVAARSLVLLCEDDVGREVALGFDKAHSHHPTVLGFICGRHPVHPALLELEILWARPPQIILDGQPLVFPSGQEATFRCGEVVVTVNRSGQVAIRGIYALDRSADDEEFQASAMYVN